MNEFEKSLQNIDVNTIYDQISKIEVPLEMQSTYNRHYIDQKIVECDRALDLLDKINTKIVRELTNYEIRHSVVEEEINNKKRNEFANNQEILKRYSTGRERESAIELLIKDSMSEFSKLNRKILALRNLSGLIKTKQSIIIKKMRNIQDQSRMMSDLLKINVPLPDDKDTALLTKALGGVEALERSLDAEEIEDAKESIEQSDIIGEITEDNTSIDLNESESLEVSLTNTDPMPSDVTKQVSSTTSSEVDTSDLDLGNTASQSSTEIELDSKPTDEESEALSDETSEETEESELDMDTVLDGLDPVSNPEEGTAVENEPESSDAVVIEGNEDTTLEDIISGDDTVVTEKPAKKSGQREPSSKDNKSKKESVSTKKPSEDKKVLKEDNATAPGDVDIGTILDDLNNI
jgi:hypothetical protein